MAYTNRNFTWDFDALKRFYERYIVKWLNSAVSWTEAQKKQARANLGFGDGDIDATPSIVSANLVTSKGVAESFKTATEDAHLDTSLTSYSTGWVEFNKMDAGKKYYLSVQLTGFEGNMIQAIRLYNTRDSANPVNILPLFDANKLESGEECIIEFTPEFDITYIIIRYFSESATPPASNRILISAKKYAEKYALQTDLSIEQTRAIGAETNLQNAINAVSSEVGTFDLHDYIVSRNKQKSQEIALISDITNTYFLDTYSYYNGCVKELYVVGNFPDICFKYYSNRIFLRPLDTNGYKFTAVVDLRTTTVENNKLIVFTVTTAGTDTNYAVGDVVGYAIFSDIETFIANPLASNPMTLIENSANSLDDCPNIRVEIGGFDSIPHITQNVLKLPYEIVSPTITALKQDTENNKKSINILFIGNSYTANSVSYVPFILKNVAPNLKFKIGILFLDGGSLSDHLANLLNEDVVSENGTTVSPQTYDVYANITNEMTAWNKKTNKNMSVGLQDAVWDIISIHQANRFAALSWNDNYAPFIYRIHKELSEALNYKFKLGWDIIHGSNKGSYAADKAKYLDIVTNSELIDSSTCTEIIFPYGTAVENLRTIESLRLLGDDENHNLLKDGSHLQSGIGQLAASYAIAIKIMQEVGCVPKIIAENTLPTTEWVTAINTVRMSDIGTGSIGVTTDNCFLAQIAAIQAVKNPYEITDINNYNV